MAKLDTAGASHVGRVRKNNEDSFVICNSSVTLAVVADGIGGHAHGEVASQMCCTLLAEKFRQSSMDDTWSSENAARTLFEWIEETNTAIFERNKEEMNPLPMGSTVCAALFFPDFIVSANAGDSRLYALDKKRLKLLTRDHVVCQNGGCYLSRAVGVAKKARPEMKVFSCKNPGKFILVSDGIYNSMSEKELASLVNKGSNAALTAEQVISRANECGGVDNLTCVAVFGGDK